MSETEWVVKGMAERVCKVCGGGPVRAKGKCHKCYQSWWRANRGVGVGEVKEMVGEGQMEIIRRVSRLLEKVDVGFSYRDGEMRVEVGDVEVGERDEEG
jgi:hypothetical protein